MRLAVTREVSPGINSCELTHLKREEINLDLAIIQHRQYEEHLADLGCNIHTLPAESQLPDSVFVEDTAIILDELAVITRPGAVSRRPETESVKSVIKAYRMTEQIKWPGFMDGGDVLKINKTLYVGLTDRSNREAFKQLQFLVKPFGYKLQEVKVNGCLHLKSAVTLVADETLLINPNWVDVTYFGNMNYIQVHSSEPLAANALLIDNTVLYSSAYPLTKEKLEKKGISVRMVDLSELAKAEGAVTCCSLIFKI